MQLKNHFWKLQPPKILPTIWIWEIWPSQLARTLSNFLDLTAMPHEQPLTSVLVGDTQLPRWQWILGWSWLPKSIGTLGKRWLAKGHFDWISYVIMRFNGGRFSCGCWCRWYLCRLFSQSLRDFFQVAEAFWFNLSSNRLHVTLSFFLWIDLSQSFNIHKSGIILIEATYYDVMEAPLTISWVCTLMLRYPTLLVNLQRKISVLVWLTRNMIFSQWFGTPLQCYDRSLAVWKRSYIMIIVPCFHQVDWKLMWFHRSNQRSGWNLYHESNMERNQWLSAEVTWKSLRLCKALWMLDFWHIATWLRF